MVTRQPNGSTDRRENTHETCPQLRIYWQPMVAEGRMTIFFGALVIDGCPFSVNGPTRMCIQTTPIRFCGILNLKTTKK